jgi:hypothetical protein
MSTLGKILCSGTFPRLGQEPAVQYGLRAFFDMGKYRPHAPFNGKTFRIDHIPIVDFSPCLSFDFERFALSCKESRRLALAERSLGNLVSWPLIKMYYSAFFGAHALLRSRGAGVAFLSKKDLKFLDSVFQAYFPNTQPIKGGNYLFQADLSGSAAGEISMIFEATDASGGVHESFWFSFCDYFDAAATAAVTNSLADSSTFLAEVNALCSFLKDKGGGGIWVSMMRNSINYQHSHEVWIPVRKGSEAGGLLSAIPVAPVSSVQNDRSKRPLRAFLDTCQYVSELSDVVGDYVAERSTKGGAFGQKWRRLNAQLN